MCSKRSRGPASYTSQWKGERQDMMSAPSIQLDRTTLLALYRTMVEIRKTEEQLAKSYSMGAIPGACHTYIGEEAVATGVCAHLRPDVGRVAVDEDRHPFVGAAHGDDAIDASAAPPRLHKQARVNPPTKQPSIEAEK